MEPQDLFKGEPEETIEKVKQAMHVMQHFKHSYEVHRKKISTYFIDKEPVEWEFPNALVFHRFNQYMERVQITVVRQPVA